MRKAEWFSSFEKSLKSLPESEKMKAIEYYKELYSDKNEAGMPEKDVILSFGAPTDAAREILENYGQEENIRAFDFEDTVKEERQTDGKIAAVILATLVAIFVGYWALIAAIVLVSIEISLCAAGVGACLTGLSGLGAGLIILGVFIILVCPFSIAIKWMVKGVVRLVKKVYNVILRRATK